MIGYRVSILEQSIGDNTEIIQLSKALEVSWITSEKIWISDRGDMGLNQQFAVETD